MNLYSQLTKDNLAINCVVRISPRTRLFFFLLLIGYFRFVCVVFQLSSHDSDYLLLNIFYTWDSLNLSFCTFKMERVGKSFCFFSFLRSVCVAGLFFLSFFFLFHYFFVPRVWGRVYRSLRFNTQQHDPSPFSIYFNCCVCISLFCWLHTGGDWTVETAVMYQEL